MKKNFLKTFISFSALWLVGCGGASETSWYQPSLDTTWQWQLGGTLNTNYNVDLYDIDLFDTPVPTITALHRSGKKVICYFSAGSYEKWRSDAKNFPEVVLGKKMDGWDERWLDIRNDQVKTIMRSRLDLARTKGCDGVEPDNVDGYVNETGFDLSSDDQLSFNRFLAEEAHVRQLSIGLKNDLDHIPLLVSVFDFAVNEQCHEYNECDKMVPFIQAKKPVFNAEYQSRYVENIDDAQTALCRQANTEQFHTLVLPLLLNDTFRYACEEETKQ